MNSIIKLQKPEDLEKLLANNAGHLVVLFFSAEWSEESKLMSDVVVEMLKSSQINQSTRFIQLDAEQFEDISLNYAVEAVPTFVFLRNKDILQRVVGADAVTLRKQVEQASQVAQTFVATNVKPDLNTRLENLINQAPVVLFMKGSPQEPRCGFSRQTIEILKNENCPFSYYDILSDNEVREGLKKFSNWPTYPQLYMKGELIGGLDIIKEMVESGEFKSMIPAAKEEETLNDRLKKLLKRSKIMLFMKGNPSQPQCGFSRTIVGILNETGHKYDSFDILSDEEVRAGLKVFSNWPTYPQLYVDGELVGGLDIVKELVQQNELEDALKGK